MESGRKAGAPTELVEIEKPVYGGAFLARVEGKAVFVPLALPGEQTRVRITQSKANYSTAEAEEIVHRAPVRIAPACPHFGVCGGCHYQHTDYATQLEFKRAILQETLERAGVAVPGKIGVLAGEGDSQPWQYRNRIRLAFDAKGNPGYRGRRSHDVIAIRECPIAAPLLVKATFAVADVVRKVSLSLRPVELALFCNFEETSLLVSISVSRAAKIRFDEFAQALAHRIPELKGAELVIDGRAAQTPRRVTQWGEASLLYRAAGFDYRVDYGAFFQVNRWLLDALVERVTGGKQGPLAWDLFAGVGLFAHKLTESFGRVVAVESAPSSIKALAANLKGTRGAPLRAATLEFLRRNRKGEPGFVTPDFVVVDPPRTGLGAETCRLLGETSAPALAYVSCDPATLARDLHALTASGYAIDSVTLVDLFPQTFHLETLVHLRRA